MLGVGGGWTLLKKGESVIYLYLYVILLREEYNVLYCMYRQIVCCVFEIICVWVWILYYTISY